LERRKKNRRQKEQGRMKRVIALAFLAILTISCGILDLAFTDIPQRYIDREVKDVELVGFWKLTSDSENRVGSCLSADSSCFVRAPWRVIAINSNGTCQVNPEIPWISDSQDILRQPDALASCTWQLKEILGYKEDGTFRDVLGIFLRLEHLNSQTDTYELYYSGLFIVEENGELILWDYIGDPVNANYQDFKKSRE
jgi:hypothetical protein